MLICSQPFLSLINYVLDWNNSTFLILHHQSVFTNSKTAVFILVFIYDVKKLLFLVVNRSLLRRSDEYWPQLKTFSLTQNIYLLHIVLEFHIYVFFYHFDVLLIPDHAFHLHGSINVWLRTSTTQRKVYGEVFRHSVEYDLIASIYI